MELARHTRAFKSAGLMLHLAVGDDKDRDEPLLDPLYVYINARQVTSCQAQRSLPSKEQSRANPRFQVRSRSSFV